MTSPAADIASADRWYDWICRGRFGGDLEAEHRLMRALEPIRDRILAAAQIRPGDHVLDVGCGDGLLGVAAAEAVGPDGLVTFSDVSENLLARCRQRTEELGLVSRCRFVNASAEDLLGVASESVDVVTTRSVLIYVSDKERALGEFHRVLRANGRLSLYEPLRAFETSARHRLWGYDVRAVAAIAEKIRSVYDRANPPETDPMFDFDEWRLLEIVENLGFSPIVVRVDATYEASVNRRSVTPAATWDAFLASSPNPTAPSIQDALAELTSAEQVALIQHLRPLVEAGDGETRSAALHLIAVKS
jgi:arsenite methyltransferase